MPHPTIDMSTLGGGFSMCGTCSAARPAEDYHPRTGGGCAGSCFPPVLIELSDRMVYPRRVPRHAVATDRPRHVIEHRPHEPAVTERRTADVVLLGELFVYRRRVKSTLVTPLIDG